MRHASSLAVRGIHPHPDHPVTAISDHHLADLTQQRRFVPRMHERLVATTDRPQGAGDSMAGSGNGAEVTVEMRDFVRAPGARRRLLVDPLSCRKPRHRSVQELDPTGDEEVQRDSETEHRDEHHDHHDSKLLPQAVGIDRLGEAQIGEQQDQRAAVETQIARSGRQCRRHDDGQFVTIDGKLRHHTSGLARLLHRRGDAALFACRYAERSEIERVPGPVTATAQHHHVVCRYEHAGSQLFEHAQLAELTLPGLEFAALGGTLRAALNFSRAQKLRALEGLLETRLLRTVRDDVQNHRDRCAVQHQQQRHPETQRAEVAAWTEPRHR